MSKRVGILTAAAFGLTAGVSVVSAQFVSTFPAHPGNSYASQSCGCSGGGSGSKVGCFSCCTNQKFEGGNFSVDPSAVRVCFGACGLERRNSPCTGAVNPHSELPLQ